MAQKILVCAIMATLYFTYCINCTEGGEVEGDPIGKCLNGNLILISPSNRKPRHGMSEENRQIVLNAHNNYRRKMGEKRGYCKQPKAVGLIDLEYDEDLEDEAFAACMSCNFTHNIFNDDPLSKIGQNMAVKKRSAFNSTYDWDHPVDQWMSECNSFTYPNISLGITGHYTQVVAARTRKVGCYGIIHKTTGVIPLYQTLYFCNYFPSGNMNKEAPYHTA